MTIRDYVRFAILTIIVCALATWLPGWLTCLPVPETYDDLSALTPNRTYWLRPGPFAPGQIVAFRHGPLPADVGFARIAAVGGDTIELRGGKLLITGQEYQGWNAAANAAFPSTDLGPVVVPADHLFVLSDRHRHDSTVHGMIGMAAVLGRIRE